MTKKDLKEILEHLEDIEVRREIFYQDLIFYPEDLEGFYESLLTSKDKIVFLIVKKEYRKIVGMIFIKDIDFLNRNCEIAYHVVKEERNKGFETEAVKLALKEILRKFTTS